MCLPHRSGNPAVGLRRTGRSIGPPMGRSVHHSGAFIVRVASSFIAVGLAAAPVVLAVFPANALMPGQTICYGADGSPVVNPADPDEFEHCVTRPTGSGSAATSRSCAMARSTTPRASTPTRTAHPCSRTRARRPPRPTPHHHDPAAATGSPSAGMPAADGPVLCGPTDHLVVPAANNGPPDRGSRASSARRARYHHPMIALSTPRHRPDLRGRLVPVVDVGLDQPVPQAAF